MKLFIKSQEEQIVFLENKQGQDLEVIENRLDAFLQETSKSKSETEKFRKQEEMARKEINEKEKEIQLLKKKLEKYKRKVNEKNFQLQEVLYI